jgi:uncharacterized protein
LRIERQTNFPLEMLPKGAVESKTTSTFSSFISKSQSKLQLEALNQLMSRLETQGQILSKQRTIENLRDYKKMVKQFIGEAVGNGLQLSENLSHNPHGGMKSHQLVKIVDRKLLELHEEVIHNEERGMEVLRLVGEIKGLLINLYM